MTIKKYRIISVIFSSMLVLILLYTFCFNSTNAYADDIVEATVISESTSSETTTTSEATVTTSEVSTSNTTSDSQTIVTTSNQAPVSIAVYSNEVTESSDTYDYTNKEGNQPIDDSNVVTPTAAPDSGNEVTPAPEVTQAPVATKDPQSTASPDATPEPDIISYPPTVAPAYTD